VHVELAANAANRLAGSVGARISSAASGVIVGALIRSAAHGARTRQRHALGALVAHRRLHNVADFFGSISCGVDNSAQPKSNQLLRRQSTTDSACAVGSQRVSSAARRSEHVRDRAPPRRICVTVVEQSGISLD
jgi:hypothetical protein